MKRATKDGETLLPKPAYFNPRPREEGDNLFTNPAYIAYISIHALVKRATNIRLRRNTAGYHFNPRPREEGDFKNIKIIKLLGNFNPRPREEGDELFQVM